MRLVIVESPAKAKTINKYLGSDYKVIASYGHIRDLLSKNGSVKPEDNFSMVWEISEKGKKCVQDISKQLKNCTELLLATDPDREGEAISWHIKEVLQEKNKLIIPFKRIVFHEITKNAIKEAINNPRNIDNALVDAYLARRALDYLVGFTLSPILWRKLPGSKSAGRVQSVALRIITDREEEIEAFKKKEYWTIEAEFKTSNNKTFTAHLTHYNNKKLEKFDISNESDALAIVNGLVNDFYVQDIESKTVKRNPSPAFITSTLQQEASRKLGFSAKKTMQLAQNLYEGIDINGETIALITYMRTDSLNLSKEAIEKIRFIIQEKYGAKFIPNKPNIYTKKVKNAQEAHEAIRPIDVNITPEYLNNKISSDLLKLYTLIWKRAVASQMSAAEFNQVQVDLVDKCNNTFRANGNTIIFDGFLKVYNDSSDDDIEENKEGILPPIDKGDLVYTNKIKHIQHFTMPPPRFSEAKLVKKLEELGIGRPSTYATIIQVLQDRGYVKLVKKFFIPEIRGRLVTSFLMNFFSRYLEYGFTADMEQFLDDISNGNKTKQDVLNNFWTEFHSAVEKTKDIKISDVIDKLNESLEKFLFTNNSNEISRQCPNCKEGILSLKIGRFGSFIGCSRYPECNYVRKLDSSPTNDIDNSIINSSEYPKFLGNDTSDNLEIFLKKGPYGLYLEKNKTIQKENPIRISISKFIDINSNIDINTASFLFSLPKTIGTLDDKEIKIGIGKFGPYIFFNDKYISIPKSESIFNITKERAIKLIKEKNKNQK